MLRNTLLAALAALLAGCFTPLPQLSREESLAATTRVYPAADPETVIRAAETVLRLADGDDVRFAHAPGGFTASRFWMVYIVLAAASGTDYWQFAVTPDESGVRASVQASTQAQTISAAPTTQGGWAGATGPVIGTPAFGNAIYDVFWARMDYLLGTHKEWMSCDESNERVEQKLVWGPNDMLCNSFNVKDDAPSEPLIQSAGAEGSG